MRNRSSGILLHITSLPSKYGVGDFGPDAYKFADFLGQSGQRLWQVLPVTPPAIGIPHSPYNCLSAFAGSSLLISPELLYCRGLLDRSDIENINDFPKERVDFETVIPYKQRLLDIAYERFKTADEDFRYEHT